MPQTLADLQRAGVVSHGAASDLVARLQRGQHLLVTGARGSGKTALLHALGAAAFPPNPCVQQFEAVDAFHYRISPDTPPDYGRIDPLNSATVLPWLSLCEVRRYPMLAALRLNDLQDLIDAVATLVRRRVGFAPHGKILRQLATAVDGVVHLAQRADGRSGVAWIGRMTPQGLLEELS